MRCRNSEKPRGSITDGLSDVNLDQLVETLLQSKGLACFVSVKPKASFHMITVDEEGMVTP
jgi:glucose-1-phosphate cytidylyltransferase